MTPQEAVDLLSVAAVSTTWQGADPRLARELLEVVRRLSAAHAAHAAERASHVESRRELSLALARLGEAERQLEEWKLTLSSVRELKEPTPAIDLGGGYYALAGPVAHAGSPTVVGGTPRGPELDDLEGLGRHEQ